ncbi:MAG: hypothetical protein Q8L98_02385 [Chlamydiales bacterium]|nr:hypothetical protein [Chlamydiales bacterium]
MLLSIPNSINPIYSLPSTDPVNFMLNIGHAVKDLPNDAETTMKENTELAIERTLKKHIADFTQYNIDYKKAADEAMKALDLIGKPRIQQINAIGALVTTIITTALVLIVAAATQTWPILFAAVPLSASLIVWMSIEIHALSSQITNLEKIIARPASLHKPVYHPPVYNPSQDLDLYETRTNVQNRLASKTTLDELAKSAPRDEQLVSYALLDRVTVISEKNRPAFYGKCIQLIHAKKQIDSEYQNYQTAAETEHKRLERQLHHWKCDQDNDIEKEHRFLNQQEQNLRAQEQERARAQLQKTGKSANNVFRDANAGVRIIMCRLDLQRRREDLNQKIADVSANFFSTQEKMRNLKEKTKTAITNAYQSAKAQLEQQFVQAKAVAAV